MPKMLILNGPNLHTLGKREPNIYGDETIKDLEEYIQIVAKRESIAVEFFQSNHEGDIVTKISELEQDGFSGLIINPAAYTHTSIAIGDALSSCSIKSAEVHISNIYNREEFRKINYTAKHSIGVVAGFGFFGYEMALMALKNRLNNE
jgi:3-dehydroquinate dehydratase-2